MRQHKGKNILIRARDCQRGTAAMELSLLMAIIMVPLYFALLEISDAMTINRRVATSVNTLADLTAQSTELSPSDFSALVLGVEGMLEPQDTSTLSIKVVSVVLDDNKPVVHWSRSRNPDGSLSEPYAAGAQFSNLGDNALLTDVPSLIVVEMTYDHKPLIMKQVFQSVIQFKRNSIRYPRLSDKVQFCPTPGTCTT